jgi:hypothetical protein
MKSRTNIRGHSGAARSAEPGIQFEFGVCNWISGPAFGRARNDVVRVVP